VNAGDQERPAVLSAKAGGFSIKNLAQKTGELLKGVPHSVRQAASDLKKFRGNTTQLRDISHDSLQSELLKLL
jgi:hypothetical protein